MKQTTSRRTRERLSQPRSTIDEIGHVARLRDEIKIIDALDRLFNKHMKVFTEHSERQYYAAVCPRSFGEVLRRATIYYPPNSQEYSTATYAIARLHREFDLFSLAMIADLRSEAFSVLNLGTPNEVYAATQFLKLTKSPKHEEGDEAPLRRVKKQKTKPEDAVTHSSETHNLLRLIKHVTTFQEFQRAGLLGFYSLEEKACAAVDGSLASVKEARKKLNTLVLAEIKNPASEQSLDGAFSMLVAIMKKFGQLKKGQLALLKKIATENKEKVETAGFGLGIRSFLIYLEDTGAQNG
jgi:hypothetical protein